MSSVNTLDQIYQVKGAIKNILLQLFTLDELETQFYSNYCISLQVSSINLTGDIQFKRLKVGSAYFIYVVVLSSPISNFIEQIVITLGEDEIPLISTIGNPLRFESKKLSYLSYKNVKVGLKIVLK